MGVSENGSVGDGNMTESDSNRVEDLPDSDFPSHTPTPPPSPFDRVTVVGIKVDNVDEDEAISLIDTWIDGATPAYIAVVNAAKLVSARRNNELRRALMGADLITADGMSVVWASRLLGSPLKERVTGIDMFERLIGHAARRSASVYLLGGRDEAVGRIVKRFRGEYPNLKVAGYRNGYFTAAEADEVVEQIKQSGAELLFVAMGSPRQEIWIASNLAATGARFALGVGGAFDHLSGLSRRAPRWMQQTGMEWLYRLLSEPRRLWRRYLIGNVVFTWLVAKQLVSRTR